MNSRARSHDSTNERPSRIGVVFVMVPLYLMGAGTSIPFAKNTTSGPRSPIHFSERTAGKRTSVVQRMLVIRLMILIFLVNHDTRKQNMRRRKTVGKVLCRLQSSYINSCEEYSRIIILLKRDWLTCTDVPWLWLNPSVQALKNVSHTF